MNKYQEYLLSQKKNKKDGTFIFMNCAPVEEVCKDDTYGRYSVETNVFLIKQDSDITKTVYELVISKNECPFIETVQIKRGGAYTEVSSVTMPLPKALLCRGAVPDERFIIRTDFNDRLDAIKIKFIKNIADDLEIPLTYQEADRQAYNDMQAALLKENSLRRAAIKHSVGESLVNIYFQPCADNYNHTEISLFIPDKTEVKTVGGPHGPVDREDVLSWSLIMKTTIENGIFFKSITGLTYGRYAYIVKQFDEANNVLFETDYIEFYIRKQQPPVIEQGNIVVI